MVETLILRVVPLLCPLSRREVERAEQAGIVAGLMGQPHAEPTRLQQIMPIFFDKPLIAGSAPEASLHGKHVGAAAGLTQPEPNPFTDSGQ